MFIVTFETRYGLAARIFTTLEDANKAAAKLRARKNRVDHGEVVVWTAENID